MALNGLRTYDNKFKRKYIIKDKQSGKTDLILSCKFTKIISNETLQKTLDGSFPCYLWQIYRHRAVKIIRSIWIWDS